MINEQTIPIAFGQGLDTKTDPKAVQAGKFLQLQNAVFTNPKRISKRNGYSALQNVVANVGVLNEPQMVHNYNEELLSADLGSLLSYSPTAGAWIDRGGYISTALTRNSVDQAHPASGFIDSAVLGNYILYGYSTASNFGAESPTINPNVYASVVDQSTGSVIYGPTLQSAMTGTNYVQPVRCVLLGGTTLGIAYIKSDGSNIVIRILSFPSPGVITFGAEQTISANFTGTAFDIVGTASGATIAYFIPTGLQLKNISTAGAIGVTNTVVAPGGQSYGPPVTLNVDTANGNIWCYFSEFTAGLTTSSIQYFVMDSSLSFLLTATNIVTFGSPLFIPSNLSPIKNSTTQQTLYYGYFASSDNASTFYIDVTYSVTVTINGVVGTPALFANGVTPFSRSFSITNFGITNQYGVYLYRGFHANDGSIEIQPTLFLIQLNSLSQNTGSRLVVARFGNGLLNNQAALGTGYSQGVIAYTPNVNAISATEVLYTHGLDIQEFESAHLPGVDDGVLSGSFSTLIDFDNAAAYKSVNAGDLTILNGGVVQAYDGQQCAEFGFNLFPEITNLVQSAGSGFIANGVYSYLGIFQWPDAQGNLHQSAPSEAVSITTTGSNNTVTVTVTWNYLSQKPNSSVALYRTAASGTVYFLITDPIFTLNNPSGSVSVTFVDTLADVSIEGNPQAYTYPASAVLENSTPPPSMIMVAHNNRLIFVDSENPNTEWYTKSFEPGSGLSPSALMTQTIDGKYGNITALAEMDDKLITFKQSGIIIQSGDGVSDVGTNSTLSFPQIVPSDVGCSNLKSVVLTPVGVMFESPNGIYLIDRSLGVTYKGMEVQADNAYTITSANLIQGKSQIRFLTSTGNTIIYDYIFGQWGNFTNHLGLSADVWQGSYVYANIDGSIRKETPGSYLDISTPFALAAQTSWLALANIQGFQRVRRFLMLGDFDNGASASHGVQITAMYDFNTTQAGIALPYVFGAASVSGVVQYRERLIQQKCDSISLLIQETVTGDPLEYFDITDMSFEAAVKKGLNKLSQPASVG